MSESSSDFTESVGETKPAGSGALYTFTEEERKVFKECEAESFWFRSLPFGASAMALTHMLVVNGKLSASPRFGSLPKVLFAGLFGYIAGKLSYMKECQQKFYNLENSPIGETLRQRHGHPQRPPQFSGPQTDSSEDEKSQFPVFQSESAPKTPYSPPTFSDTHSTQPRDLPTHALRDEQQEVKRKPVLYEELRNKNRENYDITRSQKIDRDTPKMEGESLKKNKYGDAWAE